ncbi:MAG TPA: hypothetical protein VNJ02_19405 [Vicinamibacterales bacterium]|nr:hypothetical protein [Vicinamibacterales bacterium]
MNKILRGTQRCHIPLVAAVAMACLVITTTAAAHDLFFRAKQYVVTAGSEAWVEIYTGTFSTSENAVKRDLRADAIPGPGHVRDVIPILKEQ